MGANSTQAQAVCLFFIAFALIAAGLAAAANPVWIVLGVLALGLSFMLFARCKPWEHREQ